MINIKHHLLEIKLRFFYLIFSLICTFLLCYKFQIEIIYIIGKPFLEFHQTFIFLELTEAFYTVIRISTILTFLFLLPFFTYQIWVFFIPSFYKFERKKINSFFFLFLFLFLCEVFLVYFLILPQICHFLLSFEMTSEIQTSHVEPVISVEFTARIGSYVNLLVKILTTLLIIFQIPLGICFFYSQKLLHVSSLCKNRKFLFLIALLSSALLAPPDVPSQIAMNFFLFLLFELLIFIGFFFD